MLLQTLAAIVAVSTTPASNVVVVPFAPVANHDRSLDFVDEQIMLKLRDKGVAAIASEPMDALDVPGHAAELCARYNATSILIGTARSEQRQAPFYKVPTHSEIRLARLDCSGHVVVRVTGTGDINRVGGNPPAYISYTLNAALDDVLAQLP